MAEPFPLSTAVDALVESKEFEGWIEELPEDEVRRILIEAIAQLQWMNDNYEPR